MARSLCNAALTCRRDENRHRQPLAEDVEAEVEAGHVSHHPREQKEALERLSILRKRCVFVVACGGRSLPAFSCSLAGRIDRGVTPTCVL